MLVVGLTGGIGSGKTTVADLFAKLGVPIIDADVIAREITLPNQPAYLAILNRFGPPILLNDETLNRKKLREIIFNHASERIWLEQLLHPLIRAEMEKQIKELSSPYCILAIPLLIETLPYTFIDRILVVDAPENQQIERVVLRDQQSAEDIIRIVKTQLDRDSRLAEADDMINNDGTLDDLKRQVEEWHRVYLALSACG